ncbi:50S ribosomal protein L19e [Halobium salinum]|uniref:Large ribosomal subunit protein eL19 n=1 Tax=Halobium salinum TaxID=1364940 RepID=A0ABD5P9E9_9EURY|nr:50S ribosomal protein L19e [Halobium salinum]
MTDLKAQKRMAADILDVGKNSVWFDPEAQAEIAEAITREDVRELVDQGTIRAEEAKGNSRGRARERNEKRAYGHRKGPGSRKGKSGGRQNSKDEWISRIRAQRARLKELRDDGPLDRTQYRTLYNKASGGEFDSVDRLEAYIRNNYGITLEDE